MSAPLTPGLPTLLCPSERIRMSRGATGSDSELELRDTVTSYETEDKV